MNTAPRSLQHLQEFFESTAEKSPDAIAVDDFGATFTYGELEQRSNQIANYLIAQNCGPNARVGIATGKNANAYAAILGALKSGACWVPIGDQIPVDRQITLFSMIAPTVAIAEPQTLGALITVREQIGERFPILVLGTDAPDADADGEAALGSFTTDRPARSSFTPEDLAYIIFTSGSTGEPKGVMVYHRNITQFLNLCGDLFSIDTGSRFAHQSEITFDPSLFDMFHCWATGGTLIPNNRRHHRINPGQFIKQSGANVVFTVPSVINTLERSGQIGSTDLSSITHLLLTGEAVPPRLVNAWREAYPGCRVFNLYGTTETAIISHCYEFDSPLLLDTPVIVGQPLRGIRVMLLDGDEPVAMGEVGESVVVGSQISPGYWRNEAETATRFVTNPLDPNLPQAVYRTGDLLRLRDDGEYEFIGRADDQVKVRGHRIELGEVEAALMPHDGIEEVAVIVMRDAKAIEEAYLVAFISGGETVDVEDVKSFLGAKLPSYMVPSRLIRMDGELPKNANRKIDRRALEILARTCQR